MKRLRELLQNSYFQKIIAGILLIFLYAYLYKLLIPRINAFGCMDDCNNFMGGYFLLQGKQLFSQIFFNHAPFMAHISEFIQYIAKPQNLHEIILRHRQFLLIFGLLSELILILRFGFVALPFALLYELTKFYLAGDRFLGEGFVVYPFAYMIGVVFDKFIKKHVFSFDFFVVTLCTWFVIFIREPYAPVALVLFASLLFDRKHTRIKIISVLAFLTLFCATIFSYNIHELIYNMITVNKTTLTAENADSGVLGINAYKVFLYPCIIFFQGEWNFVRYIEMGLSALFLFTNAVFLWKKQWKWVLFLWILLGLSNFRLVRPGHEFYGAFHLLPWYAMTIFVTLLMLGTIKKWNKKLFSIGVLTVIGILLFLFLSKGSYIHDKIDQQTEFITNYGNVIQIGNVVSALSHPKDTLFVDGFEDSIYLTSHISSKYQYSWYTSLMPLYKKYKEARLELFAKNPPDFYYGSCPNEKAPYYLLPESSKEKYVQLYNIKDPSCLWVNKEKLSQITDMQWQKAGESLFYLQPHE